MIIRICTPSYTCAICFLPLYSARYNGKSVSSTASKPDWFISAFADLWHGVGLNRLVLPSESLCPSIRTSVPYLGLRRCAVGPLILSRNTISCISFLIIPQYTVFVNQFMRKNTRYFLKWALKHRNFVPLNLLDIFCKLSHPVRNIIMRVFPSHRISTKEV